MDEMFLDELNYVDETLAIQGQRQNKRTINNLTKSKGSVVRNNTKNTKRVKTQVVHDEVEVEKKIEINANLFSIEDEEVIFNVIKDSPSVSKKLSIVDEMNNIENMLTALHQASRFVNETQIKVKIEPNI